MSRAFCVVSLLLLAGCAGRGADRPQMMVLPPKAPIIKAAPAAPAVVPTAPATFKERFQSFKKKHPIRWTH